jgi:diguanylate cyclase (GGDEF)-like protein/PAS domain S-box-containing protein
VRGSRTAATAGGIQIACLGTLAAGLLASALVIELVPSPNDTSRAMFVLLAVVLVILQTRPRRNVTTRGNVEGIPLDEVPFVPALLMITPLQCLIVITVASLAGSIVLRRQWLKAAFNLGSLLLSGAVGITVVKLLHVSPQQRPGITEVAVGMVAAIALTTVSALTVRGIASYHSGSAYLPMVRELSGRIVPWTGAVTLGGVAALCVGVYPLSAVLLIGVVMFFYRAYAASVTEQLGRLHAERLQQAIVSLRTHTDPSEVREDLVAAAKELLGAELADIVPEGEADTARSTSAPLLDGQRLRVDKRLGVEQWDANDRDTLLTLAGVAGDVMRAADLIARLRTITNSQSEGVIALDMRTCITFANPAAVRMLGCTSDADVLGARIRDKLTLRNRRLPIDFTSMVEGQLVAHDADATLGPPDGDNLDIAYSITPLRAEGEHVGAVLVLRDVTERRAFQDELTRRALHDELTGLPNRRLLLERLDHALTRSSSTGLHHGLLFLDLDRFKLVNDSYGHIMGDKLLVQVAGRLRAGLSPVHSVARMSGDEFIVLIEDAPDMETVTAIAESLLQVMKEPFIVDGQRIFMSASIGVGLTQDDQGRDVVLAGIDAAAYAAKASGRNCYCVSTDASVDETRARLDLEVSLRHGLDENELELHYQPIVTSDFGKVVGVEALVRWRSPQRGILWPQQFVPIAEETGLIVPMGRWVLEDACRTLRAWTLDHPDRPPLRVSVNLSALQFAQHKLAEDVAETLASTGLPASQLCLEITETVLMSDTIGTVTTLNALHDLGVAVAIDDFGTGYSSLSYLKRFAIDVVKLDRTFIEGLVTDEVDMAIAGAVIKLTEALHMTTVAEGVETDSQRQVLVELGCPFIQGYLTSRPLPAADFLDFWTSTYPQAPVPPVTLLPDPDQRRAS